MIRFETINNVGIVLFNNPPANVMNLAFFDELLCVFKKISLNNNIDGLIITGGGRHFSSGANTEELISLIGYDKSISDKFIAVTSRVFDALVNFPFVTIAVINGCCLGVAYELSLACKYLIASKSAVISLPESQFGLMPGCGGTVRLLGRVSKCFAVDMIISGRMVSAIESLEVGLVDAISDKKNLINNAVHLIENSKKGWRF